MIFAGPKAVVPWTSIKWAKYPSSPQPLPSAVLFGQMFGDFRAREMSVAESRFQLINNDSLIHYFISYQPHLSLLINLWEFGKISKVSWWWCMNHVFKRAQSFFYISCKCLAKASYTIKNRCFSFFIYLDTDFHRLNTRPLFLYVNYIPHSKCPFKMILLLF